MESEALAPAGAERPNSCLFGDWSVEMSDITIELYPKHGEVEWVLNMLSDVGVIEHCDRQMTVSLGPRRPFADQLTSRPRR